MSSLVDKNRDAIDDLRERYELRHRIGQPAGHYYKPAKHWDFWHENSNVALAAFGGKLRLPCGGAWLLSAAACPQQFAFEIHYAADSYNHMADVNYFDPTCELWQALRYHLALYEHTIFTTKPLSEVAVTLGIYGEFPQKCPSDNYKEAHK